MLKYNYLKIDVQKRFIVISDNDQRFKKIIKTSKHMWDYRQESANRVAYVNFFPQNK